MNEKNANNGLNYGHIGDQYIFNSRSESGEVLRLDINITISKGDAITEKRTNSKEINKIKTEFDGDIITEERVNSMKNAQELYMYCKKNMHTRNWIASIKRDAITCLKDEVPRCNGLYYNSRRIEYDYVSELYAILESRCCEKVYRDDVFIAVNKIFQDIADELTRNLLFGVPYDYDVVLYAKEIGEAVLWLGPSQCAERFLHIYIQSGYDVALASLR